jgi:hypothetical protein
MSKDLTTSLQMHVFTIDTAYEVIKENLQTDEDFNGNNEEYTDEEAIEAQAHKRQEPQHTQVLQDTSTSS